MPPDDSNSPPGPPPAAAVPPAAGTSTSLGIQPVDAPSTPIGTAPGPADIGGDARPPLGSWARVYAFVVTVLVVEIAVFFAIARIYR